MRFNLCRSCEAGPRKCQAEQLSKSRKKFHPTTHKDQCSCFNRAFKFPFILEIRGARLKQPLRQTNVLAIRVNDTGSGWIQSLNSHVALRVASASVALYVAKRQRWNCFALKTERCVLYRNRHLAPFRRHYCRLVILQVLQRGPAIIQYPSSTSKRLFLGCLIPHIKVEELPQGKRSVTNSEQNSS